MGVHKILNESKESLKEYKNYPERYNINYCKCDLKNIKYTGDGNYKCVVCGSRINI
jgi:hypothetical protein